MNLRGRQAVGHAHRFHCSNTFMERDLLSDQFVGTLLSDKTTELQETAAAFICHTHTTAQ